MRYFQIRRSSLEGFLSLPSSKSQTMRAILFASLAKGQSTIHCPLASPDIDAMIAACENFGAKIKREKQSLKIRGVAGKPVFKSLIIDAQNSGQVLRFIGAIAGLAKKEITITGDESIQTNRPILPLVTALRGLGVKAAAKTDYAPIAVQGPVVSNVTYLNGQDSQPVSAIIMLSCFVEQTTTIIANNSGETPWIDLTLSWLDRLGICYQNDEYHTYTVTGAKEVSSFEYTVPGDFSSCAFPLIAALITKSEITIKNIDLQDAQGDKDLIYLLKELGASISIQEGAITVQKSRQLDGAVINVNAMIDAVPILAVLGLFGKETMHLSGAQSARGKESDRLKCITQELKKMGANIQEYPDGLIIHPSTLHSAEVDSHNDHRIAMALCVAAMTIEEPSIIKGVGCINKSYPNFYADMKKLGARLHEVYPHRV